MYSSILYVLYFIVNLTVLFNNYNNIILMCIICKIKVYRQLFQGKVQIVVFNEQFITSAVLFNLANNYKIKENIYIIIYIRTYIFFVIIFSINNFVNKIHSTKQIQ